MPRLSFAQRNALRRIAFAPNAKIGASQFDGRTSRVIAKLVELGLVVRDDSLPTYPVLELSEAGRRLVIDSHEITVETAPGRYPDPPRSRFVCVCGVAGDWTSPDLAFDAGLDHRRLEQ